MGRVARFFDLHGIKEVLRRDMDGIRGIRSKNKDRVVCITGYEGTGKSNLLLAITEFWFKEILQMEITKDLITYVASNKQEFVTALKEAKKFYMVSHDEAGKDLYARNSISSFNKDLNIAYQVIRGKNIYTILVIPSILDLDPFFRRRRVTAMIHVSDAGKLSYFSKEKLRKIIPCMMRMAQYNTDPNPLRCYDANNRLIFPNFFDTFKIYNGELLEMYLARKENNMDSVIDELFAKYGSGDEEETKTKKKAEVDNEDYGIRFSTQASLDMFKMKYKEYKRLVDEGVAKHIAMKQAKLGNRFYSVCEAQYFKDTGKI